MSAHSELFSRKNVINDIKEIIKNNDYYLTQPFKNYNKFLEGFCLYLSYLRLKGDEDEHKFETYLNKLYENKSFFKKLQGMSGTDSTRKNIFKFFRTLENPDFGKPIPREGNLNISTSKIRL